VAADAPRAALQGYREHECLAVGAPRLQDRGLVVGLVDAIRRHPLEDRRQLRLEAEVDLRGRGAARRRVRLCAV
jgi:hypothetical protein